MNKKIILILTLSLVIILVLSGCTPENGTYTVDNPAGFWWGTWHGMCSGINLIRGIFNSDAAIYEPFNTGGWYNFGFLWGAGALTGGASYNRKRRYTK